MRLPSVAEGVVSLSVSPLRSVQVPQVGLLAQVSTSLSPSVAVQAWYWTS